MREKITYLKLLSTLLLILLILSSCERIDLIAYTLGIPLKADSSWGSFEMVIDVASEGFWDSNRIGDSAVILDGDTYRIWYSGHNGSNYRILYADSTDGKTWGNFTQALDLGNITPYDDAAVRFPTVIKIGIFYKMWYSGIGGPDGIAIIYCDSTNGADWLNHEVVVNAGDQGTYDASGSWSPTVMLDEGIYKMWYSGINAGLTGGGIIYCDSLDGKSWSNHQVAVDIGNLSGYDDMDSNSPTVIKDGGLYKMWYSGQNQTGADFDISTIYCDSEDGINWDNFQLAIEAGAEGTYDSNFVTGPMVINNNGTGMMWYRGGDDTNMGRIIYCETQ